MVTASPQSQRIVVTGLGLVTALEFGLGPNWKRLLAGDSAVRVVEDAFDTPLRLPVRLGARLSRQALASRIQAAVPRQVWNTSAEPCHAWLLAALEAMQHAGWGEDPPVAADRVGVYVGCGGGATDLIERELNAVYTAQEAARRDVSRMVVPKYMTSALAAQLCILRGFRGPAQTVNTACASGAYALLAARDAMGLGRIDAAVVGGTELPVTATILKGFANIAALSTSHDRGARACRPFDADRDGFVLGEGAGCLILEREEAARARGATPLAVLSGGAATSEAHHLLAPRDEGAGMAACMAAALRDSAVDAPRVAHVYAHATATAYNDRYEARALGQVLPHGPTVSASKAQLGHTIGAAAAIDAVLAVQTLRTGRALPLAHRERPDPECPVRPADAAPLAAGADAAVLVNSFAFGGHNASVLFTAAADGAPTAGRSADGRPP